MLAPRTDVRSRPRRRAPVRRTLLAVLALVLLASCSATGGASGGDGDRGRAQEEGSASTSVEPGGDDASPPLDAEGAREALGPSMALISTPDATGSSVLVADGYLVTNAHVVDPYAEVDVTFLGGDRIEQVPVAQVDLVADLALVGPIDDLDAPPVEIVAPEGDAEGGGAYLVGFPDAQDPDDPELKVTEGELAGLVVDDGWDLSYVRSTTPIRDGQSGGALVDAGGRVIGISSMSDDDSTALSVEGGDVAASIAALRDFDGSDWTGIHLDDADTSFAERPVWDGAVEAYYVPSGGQDREVVVTVDGPEPQVAVGYPGDATYPWGISGSIDADADDDAWYVDDAEPLEPAGDGAWRVPLLAGEPAVITVAVAAGTDEYDVELSEPAIPISVDGEDIGLVIGTPRRVIVDSLDDDGYATVELEAGTTYEIAARTPSSDAAWSIISEVDPDDGVAADDGGGGLFDTDAVDTFTPREGGTYSLLFTDAGEVSTAMELEISPA